MLVPSETRNKTLPTSESVYLLSLRRPSALFFCALLALIPLLPIKSLAQDPSEDDVVRVSTDLLLFPIRIRDKRGQAVKGLEQDDLALKDKDQVTAGLYFAPGADRVAIVFALDQSGACARLFRSSATLPSLCLAVSVIGQVSQYFVLPNTFGSGPFWSRSAAARGSIQFRCRCEPANGYIRCGSKSTQDV